MYTFLMLQKKQVSSFHTHVEQVLVQPVLENLKVEN